MSSLAAEVRPGAYYDSVVLMQLQRALAALPGVVDAGVVMATPANQELLEQSELLPDGVEAGADDLLIVIRAEGQAEADDALGQVDELLARRRSMAQHTYRPRSLEAAAKMLPEAGWVLISVPGRFAAQVAREALALGRHVFLYSDNVSVTDEIALKRQARDRGLLMMGPDCGTAIVNGVGLGFANHVRRGAIGLVGASGTGLQAITSTIHRLGGGISHALGTGGRDLKAEVGGITALQGIDLLARDPGTQVIVLVSKPPDREVSQRILAAAQATGVPAVVNFIGYPAPASRLGNLHFVNSLAEAAERAVALLGDSKRTEAETMPARGAPDGRRYLRGLFSGGTLASEALRGLEALLGPVHSNLGELPVADPLISQEHTLLDLGEDLFTIGRLHPMMDNDLRLRRFRQEAADPQVALILLDIVLGEGAHPDPAVDWAPEIRRAREQHGIEVAIVLVGTDEDPQDIARQREQLEAAGATIFEDTAEAVADAARRLGGVDQPRARPVALESLSTPLAVINVGLESFYESLTGQGAQAVHVEWRSPAGGDERLMDVLRKMRSKT